MLNRFVLLLILLTVYELTYSQRLSSDLWHKGHVVTVKNDTIIGEIKYNIADNYITIRQAGKLTAVSNHQLLKFQIEDTNQGLLRTFYSLPYSAYKGKKPYFIFEVLLEAPQSLLAREKVVTEFDHVADGYTGYVSMRPQNKEFNDIYFMDPKGNITAFDGRKKDMLRYMGAKYERQVRDYMKQEKLKIDDKVGLISIFRFYNKVRYNPDELE